VVSAVKADGKAAGAARRAARRAGDLESHDEGVHPFELAQRPLFVQYNLSRLIDQMVEAGLVKRMVYTIDKRGQMLFITDLDKN
jgi:DNA-binding MarR family transcriptional regulator